MPLHEYTTPIPTTALSPLPTTRDVISGKVDGRPEWICLATETTGGPLRSMTRPCDFRAPLGSKEQIRHAESAHTRKPTTKDRRQAEENQAKANAIFPDRILCALCDRDDLKPGEVHRCPGSPNADKVTPADQAVSDWKRAGLVQALDELGR